MFLFPGFGFIRDFIVKPLGALAIIGAAGAQMWQFVGPEPRKLQGPRLEVADQACAEVVAKLPFDKTVKEVIVAPFANDYSWHITDSVRSGLDATGRYHVRGRGFVEQARQRLGMDPPQVATKAEALSMGKSMGADAVIYGRVAEHLQDGKTSATVTVDVAMSRVTAGEELTSFSVTAHTGGGPLSSESLRRHAEAAGGLLWRLVAWALACVALPLLLTAMVRRVTGRESNALNLVMLASFVFADLLLAVMIFGLTMQSAWGAILLITLLVIGGAYNYAVCSRIDELAK